MSLLKNFSGEVSGMAADEDLIARILQLFPTHPTLGAVMGASALRDVPTADVLAAVHILVHRGQINRPVMSGHNPPPRSSK
jgi:hypothetical protein